MVKSKHTKKTNIELAQLKKKADLNDIDAQIELADEYIGNKKFKDAMELLLNAARMGSAKAQYNIGKMYLSGQAGTTNEQTAAIWFKQAADKRYIPAMVQLIMNYFDPEFKGEKNLNETVRLSKIAAHFDGRAQFILGKMYSEGIGVPKDRNLAIENLRNAAIKEIREAQFHLGLMLLHSEGTEQNEHNIKEGIKWLTKAAQNGHIRAIYKIRDLQLLNYKTEISEEEVRKLIDNVVDEGKKVTHYEHFTQDWLGGERDHDYQLSAKEFKTQNSDNESYEQFLATYGNLKGDHLKSSILKQFKSQIVNIKSESELNDYVDDFKQSIEYKVLSTGQDFTTRLFKIETSSLKALNKIVDEQKKEIKSNDQQLNP